MAMLDEVPELHEAYKGGKPMGRIVAEIIRFFVHSFIPILIVAGFFLGTSDLHLSVPIPELVCAAFAFVVPALFGVVIALIWKDRVAMYVWIMGLLWFSIISVFVLDMPTGPGLCEHCGAGQKLWLTFFDMTQDSGLMNNNGRLVGTWPTLSLIGYSLGARLVLKDRTPPDEGEWK
jgi:hypothetical protein